MEGKVKKDANVAQDDELGLLVLEDGTAGIEVVDATTEAVALALAAALTLALVEVVAGDVGHEVVGPADQLLPDEHEEGDDGGLLGELGELVGHAADAGGVLLAGLGVEDHVPLDVGGGLVVLAVGDLPAEVGHEEGRVEEPAGGVVDDARGREGLVTALMGDDPEAGAEEALEDAVQTPEDGPRRLGGDVLGGHEVVGEVEGGGKAGHVPEDVGPATDGGPLEAVLGDGIADVLDGIVGRGEGVAVGVDEVGVRRRCALGGSGFVHVNRREGGQRRR
jgi:hypothetical protein